MFNVMCDGLPCGFFPVCPTDEELASWYPEMHVHVIEDDGSIKQLWDRFSSEPAEDWEDIPF